MWKMTWKDYRNCAITCFAGFLVFSIGGVSLYDPRTWEYDGIAVVFSIVLALCALIAGVVLTLKVCNLLSEEQKQEKPFENPVPLFMDNTFSDDGEDFLTCGDDELHERFSRLKKLYEDDLITEEEYEQKKEELLEKL